MRAVVLLAAVLASLAVASLSVAVGQETLLRPLDDTTAPIVLAVDPAGNVSVEERALHVRFNESMNASVADVAILKHEAEDVGITTSWIENGTVLVVTLSPGIDFEWESNYTLVVTTAATDLAGNPLAADYTHAFTTEEIPEVPTQLAPVAPWIVLVLGVIILVGVFLALYPSKKR